jgi:nucleoside-diphosphate-sugar epimerase
VQGRLYLIPQTGKRLCFSTCQVLDVCRAAEFLARIAETTAKIYNICDDSRYLLKEIFYFVSSQTKNKIYGQIPLWLISFLANFLPIEKAEIDYLYYPYLMSNQKIKNLGFKLFYPDLKTGLKETIQWYLKRPS